MRIQAELIRREQARKSATRGIWIKGRRGELRRNTKLLKRSQAFCRVGVGRPVTEQQQQRLQPEAKGGSFRKKSTVFPEKKRRSEALTWRVQRGWMRDSAVPGSRPLCACTLEKRHMTGKARRRRATKTCATPSDGRHTGTFSFPVCSLYVNVH